ncbi:MAG: 50S ribosomal protein L11 [Nanoarchaeota archaeon]
MQIKLLAEGGAMKPGPTLSQKLGPAGININQVIQKVNEATKNFQGMKVPIELDINPSTKTFEVKVFSPPVSELVKKELGIEKGSGLQKKSYAGNVSIEQIISIAQTKMQNLLCKDLKSAVKTIAGTCVSLGVLVENVPASQVGVMIDNGKFDKEIKAEKTVTSSEKKKAIDDFFTQVKAEQEKIAKQEQAAKDAAAQAVAATATTTATTAAAPAAGAKKEEAAKPAAKAEAPKEEKKGKKEQAKKK